MMCSIPAVARVGLGTQGAAIDIWVRLNADDDESQDTLYGALQRFRAGGDGPMVDLRVVFPDEDETAWPSAARVVFTRE